MQDWQKSGSLGAVIGAVSTRRQRAFVERGLAAAEEARARNRYVSAPIVLRRLRKQLDAAKQATIPTVRHQREDDFL